MSCALGLIRWIIFLVNFIFALCGLLLFGIGIYMQFNLSDVEAAEMQILRYPTIFLIIIGATVFIIAFFGCCGAVQESHCMIVSFALMLLTVLVIQVCIAAYGYWQFKDEQLPSKINAKMQELIEDYPKKDPITLNTVNALQIFGDCCGYNSFTDYTNRNIPIPYSCCGKAESKTCTESESNPGCKDKVYDKLQNYGKLLGLSALVVAAVELVGVIFSFCLANSIRNADRRAYKV